MLIDQDAIELGSVPNDILYELQNLTPTLDWTKPEFDRKGVEGMVSRIVRVPYNIRREPDQEQTEDVLKVLTAFNPVDLWIKTVYPDHVFIKCEINWLFPGDMLPYHRDPTWWHEHSHRIHIPVLTNPECFWLVEGRETHLKVGKYYEINNRKFHTVINRGSTPRLHLVFDILENNKYQEVLDNNINIDAETCIKVYYKTTEECLQKAPFLADYK